MEMRRTPKKMTKATITGLAISLPEQTKKLKSKSVKVNILLVLQTFMVAASRQTGSPYGSVDFFRQRTQIEYVLVL